MYAPRLRRSLLILIALLFLSVSWVPSSSPPTGSRRIVSAPPLPLAGPRTVSQYTVDAEKLSRAQSDPNAAEYFYQQALLLIGRGQRKEAAELLAIYAQSGRNPRQVARAETLFAEVAR
jgi:hypothetical protein